MVKIVFIILLTTMLLFPLVLECGELEQIGFRFIYNYYDVWKESVHDTLWNWQAHWCGNVKNMTPYAMVVRPYLYVEKNGRLVAEYEGIIGRGGPGGLDTCWMDTLYHKVPPYTEAIFAIDSDAIQAKNVNGIRDYVRFEISRVELDPQDDEE